MTPDKYTKYINHLQKAIPSTISRKGRALGY